MPTCCPAGRIIHADNSAFFPSFFVTFENIRFTGGAAGGLGGAFFNNGKLQVRRVDDVSSAVHARFGRAAM